MVNKDTTHTYWRGGNPGTTRFVPYYCPTSWLRFSLSVPAAMPGDWQQWRILYHGTKAENVHKILQNGFWARKCQHDCKAVYLTPSILYAAHPRYARVYHTPHKRKPEGRRYTQFVLEVRVHEAMIAKVRSRSLCVSAAVTSTTARVFDRLCTASVWRCAHGMHIASIPRYRCGSARHLPWEASDRLIRTLRTTRRWR